MVKLDITQKIMFEQFLKEEYEIIEGSHFRQRRILRPRSKQQQHECYIAVSSLAYKEYKVTVGILLNLDIINFWEEVM